MGGADRPAPDPATDTETHRAGRAGTYRVDAPARVVGQPVRSGTATVGPRPGGSRPVGAAVLPPMGADHRVPVHPGDAGGIYPRTGAAGWVPVRRVLICDERPRAVQVLTELVTAIPSVVDIDGVRDGFGAVDAFAAHPAGVVLIGIQAGRNTGTDAANLLLGMHPAAAVIVYGTAGDIGPLTAAVIRGARGLMLWNPDSGNRPAPPQGPHVGSSWPVGDRGSQLTVRELQVLHGMSRGQSNRHIGRELVLSEDTVKADARRMFHKLGARDRAHAVALGLRTGLVT